MKIITGKPYFLFLLPAFFMLHSLVENFAPVLVKTAVLQTLFYSGIALVLTILFHLLFRNILKAALAVFFIMSCNFFFGSVYDFLRSQFGHSFLTRFSIIIPVMLLVILLVILYLKKSNRLFIRTSKYLNLLLLLLILIDTGALIFKLISSKKPGVIDLYGDLKKCSTCSKPDIYFIIADEYAGKTELLDLFSFDNSAFENDLKSRGFHIVNNSTSNYNATVYSLASMLNMSYIKNMNKPTVVNHRDMLMCRSLIKKNNFVSFIEQNGYEVYNYSFFDIADKKKAVRNLFYPNNRSLLTHQTFINRFIYHFGARFASKEKINSIRKNDLNNDIKVDSLTRSTVLGINSKPKFVYTHLNMPHNPYFLDRNGKEVSFENISYDSAAKGGGYIEYLQYSNTKLLSLVDFIKKNSTNPPVIFLMGDHGFKQPIPGMKREHFFMNLNAVYFPNGDYAGFYEGMSLVNQFRVTLNTLFSQKLPMLKDSTSFLTE